MVTAMMVLARLGPMTATMRMASTQARDGDDQVHDAHDDDVDDAAERRRRSRPSATPTTTETTITDRPMKSEMRAP